MHKITLTIAMLSLAVMGCSNRSCRTMAMGKASGQAAFIQARSVLAEYFRIIETDSENRSIKTAWKYTKQPDNSDFAMPMATNTIRQLAYMKIRSEDGVTWADIRITQQRQKRPSSFASYSQMEKMWDNENSHLLTPAMTDGPYKPEQQVMWQSDGHNQKLERAILESLYKRLNPSHAIK